jgi:cytochrome c oxidase cbb3-type subunit 4
MIKNVLTSIGGVENYGIISIIIFFTFFLGVLVWAFSRRQDYLHAMSTLPLDRDNQGSQNNSKNHPANKLL